MTPRSMIFTAGNMTKTSGPPPSDSRCDSRTHNPKPKRPPPGSPGRPRASPNLKNMPHRLHGTLLSPPAMATLPATDGARTHFGRTAPTGPPSTGHRSPLPAAAITATPGKSNAPFPTRRTSPVMTNDRVSPLSPWAESRRNGSAIRRPISCRSPRRPARVSVRLFAAAS